MEQIILSIAGPLILLLLGVIGYYIVRESKRQDVINDKLFAALELQRQSTDKLNLTITSLNGVLIAAQFKIDEFEKLCLERRRTCHVNFEKE